MIKGIGEGLRRGPSLLLSVVLSLQLLGVDAPRAFAEYIDKDAVLAVQDGEAVQVSTWAELSAAMQAGGEVKLKNNITRDEDASAPLSVNTNSSVTLDLAGFSIYTHDA